MLPHPMAKDSQSLATKKDIQILMDKMGKTYDRIERLHEDNAKWKDEILDTMDKRMDKRLKESEDKIINNFNVVAENIHHDTAGANKDEIEVLKDSRQNHEKRIIKLEKHTSLVATA